MSDLADAMQSALVARHCQDLEEALAKSFDTFNRSSKARSPLGRRGEFVTIFLAELAQLPRAPNIQMQLHAIPAPIAFGPGSVQVPDPDLMRVIVTTKDEWNDSVFWAKDISLNLA